ncbi:HIT family protein [Luteolibacter soli]|uniref:HIT family protein n=1 Tax=Luteolibacter soli TaxID=3135280 RepID=A0ABU9AMU6_9BACT
MPSSPHKQFADPATSDCIFCRIASSELEASLVFESPAVIAFLDLSPINPGHTLVIPRRHVSSFSDLQPAEAHALVEVAQRIATCLKAMLPDCEGITLSLADGEVAGQEVPHAHFHVIPRHANDHFGWRRFGQRAERSHLDSTAARLREQLKSER